MKRVRKKRNSISKTIVSAFIGLIIWCVYWLVGGNIPITLPDNGQPASMYANQIQDDLSQVVLSGIGNAKKTILLIIYALTDDKIAEELKRKSNEGIDVRVICDAKASPYITQKLGPKVQVLRRFSPGLMHQKILVVDGVQTLIGSANMTGESLRFHGNLIMAIHSPQLAQIIEEKASGMTEYEPTPYFAPQTLAIGGQRAEMWFLPNEREAVKCLSNLIETAQKTIRVAMFTWTRNDLAKNIIDAKKRGVDVKVVIDHHSGLGSSSKIVQMLRKGGVPVKLSSGSALLHHKFLYVDGKILVNGSANWTKAAFTKNDDCFLILHDLIEPQRQQMDRLWDVIMAESTSAH